MSSRRLRGMTRLAVRSKRKPQFNMAPMIDCVFLLLIFFMVTTTFSPTFGILVKLPRPSAPTICPPARLIVRMVNPEGVQTEGMMIIDNEIVGFNEMFRRFTNTPAELKNSIIIQSNRAVPHGQIMRVIDIALQAGIGKINFAPVARADSGNPPSAAIL